MNSQTSQKDASSKQLEEEEEFDKLPSSYQINMSQSDEEFEIIYLDLEDSIEEFPETSTKKSKIPEPMEDFSEEEEIVITPSKKKSNMKRKKSQ